MNEAELAAGHVALLHLVRADPQHEDDRAEHGGDDQRGQRGAHAGAPDRGAEARSALAAKRRVSSCSCV